MSIKTILVNELCSLSSINWQCVAIPGKGGNRIGYSNCTEVLILADSVCDLMYCKNIFCLWEWSRIYLACCLKIVLPYCCLCSHFQGYVMREYVARLPLTKT